MVGHGSTGITGVLCCSLLGLQPVALLYQCDPVLAALGLCPLGIRLLSGRPWVRCGLTACPAEGLVEESGHRMDGWDIPLLRLRHESADHGVHVGLGDLRHPEPDALPRGEVPEAGLLVGDCVSLTFPIGLHLPSLACRLTGEWTSSARSGAVLGCAPWRSAHVDPRRLWRPSLYREFRCRGGVRAGRLCVLVDYPFWSVLALRAF